MNSDESYGICRIDFRQSLLNEGYYSHPICLRFLSYLSLVSVTLVDHLLSLILLKTYFRNNLTKWHMVWVNYESFIIIIIIKR